MQQAISFDERIYLSRFTCSTYENSITHTLFASAHILSVMNIKRFRESMRMHKFPKTIFIKSKKKIYILSTFVWFTFRFFFVFRIDSIFIHRNQFSIRCLLCHFSYSFDFRLFSTLYLFFSFLSCRMLDEKKSVAFGWRESMVHKLEK